MGNRLLWSFLVLAKCFWFGIVHWILVFAEALTSFTSSLGSPLVIGRRHSITICESCDATSTLIENRAHCSAAATPSKRQNLVNSSQIHSNPAQIACLIGGFSLLWVRYCGVRSVKCLGLTCLFIPWQTTPTGPEVGDREHFPGLTVTCLPRLNTTLNLPLPC